MAFLRLLTLTLTIVTMCVFAIDIQKLCRSDHANKSCGQCIKQHTECAWCLDPHSTSPFRCDYVKAFDGKCNANLIYSPKTEVKIAPQNNLPLRSRHADGSTIIQLEPQQVILRMKPGDIVEVPFKYLHRSSSNQKDFVVQTSEFRSLGIGIEFSVHCHGHRVQGRQCANVRDGEVIEFFAKVSLNECKASGDVAISIGAYGYHTVSAMFITPLCGCDCEKLQNQEKRSPLCYGFGDLVCGVCECQPGKGGGNCECDLKQYGARSPAELDDRCRSGPNEPICSGNGRCRCGQCQCSSESITGQYCECEGLSCPTVDGQLCGGQGECQCGKCLCEEGFTGDDCSCSLDTSRCMEGDSMCSNNGVCQCGKCVCNDGYTGLTCGISTVNEMDDEIAEDLDQEEHVVDSEKSKDSLERQLEEVEESLVDEQERDEPVNEKGEVDHSEMEPSADLEEEGEPLSPVEDEIADVPEVAPQESAVEEAPQQVSGANGGLRLLFPLIGCLFVIFEVLI